MIHELVTPPDLPIGLPELKAQLRITHSEEDSHLYWLLEVATAEVEQLLGGVQKLGTQTWRTTFVGTIPTDWVAPYTPVQSQEAVVTDVDGNDSVQYVVGHPVVAAPLRHAILMLASHLYMHPEAVSERQKYEVPMAVKSLVGKYATLYV